jgi:GNAT superfamily N-acetyltransferase
MRHRPVGTTIRVGSAADIEVLCEIDSDAAALFEVAGFDLDLPPDHEFAVAERQRWLRCLEAGTTLLALDATGAAIGFAAAGVLDGLAYLDQLSVGPGHMRRGIGASLLRAIEDLTRTNGGSQLWLTTYRHLAWNRPFYERAAFVVVPEQECGPEILRELAYQRRWLPCPEQRTIMCKDLAS